MNIKREGETREKETNIVDSYRGNNGREEEEVKKGKGFCLKSIIKVLFSSLLPSHI